MDQAEQSGRTVEDALRRALDQIGATKDDVDKERVHFDVLDEGRKGGLFGRGARDAVVRAYWAVERQQAPQVQQQPRREPRPTPPAAPSHPESEAAADQTRRRRRGGRGRGGAAGAGAGGRDQAPGEGGQASRGPSDRRSGYDAAVPKLTDADFTRPRFEGGSEEAPSRPAPRQRPPASRPPWSGESPSQPRERRHRPEGEDVAPDINAPEVDFAAQMIDDLLRIFDISAEISIREPVTPGDGLGSVVGVIDIMGEDLGVLIGRRGDTLIAFQYLVNLVLSRHYPGRGGVTIDVEHYRHRNEERIISLARRMADRVRQTGSSITLEPMSPAERRLVHMTFVDDPEIVTNSVGEGEHRKVVISRR